MYTQDPKARGTGSNAVGEPFHKAQKPRNQIPQSNQGENKSTTFSPVITQTPCYAKSRKSSGNPGFFSRAMRN